MANTITRNQTLDSAARTASIERAVVEWLNACPHIPCRVQKDFLGKTSGMGVATIQGVKAKQYIYGGYLGRYQCEIAYRLIAANDDERLSADELLDRIGEWMESNSLAPPEGIQWWKARRSNMAALLMPYDNGTEDHAIQITITYEVL